MRLLEGNAHFLIVGMKHIADQTLLCFFPPSNSIKHPNPLLSFFFHTSSADIVFIVKPLKCSILSSIDSRNAILAKQNKNFSFSAISTLQCMQAGGIRGVDLSC